MPKRSRFIYVTPEQWKEENKDEWDKLAPYENEYAYELAKKMEQININGELYKPQKVINNRILKVTKSDMLPYTSKETRLYLDKKENKILVKWIGVRQTSVGALFAGSSSSNSWKIWLNGMGCGRWFHNFSDLENEYSNQFLTEQIGVSK